MVGGSRSGAVLALVGPPGVGKTSLGESVARAMGRKFVRVALGGVRDEAEIRGHRRTYVGALPGRIVRAIGEAGSMNPVVLLDEIDKVGADYRGDPTAALLEVLDPAQNHTFRDHYLDVDLDLSDVVFLATANVLDSIPGPLLDRMELVALDGYTEEEKVTIAADHLLPRQLERAGMSATDVTVTESALRLLAAEYTREAGVRDLERAIARVLRKVATNLALEKVTVPVHVDSDDLRPYLGRPRHTPESAERTTLPGVATGLAVTGAGGDVLFIEASLADPETGSTGLTLTGQLGDVMKESAQIALSYLRSHGAELELPVGDLRERGVHLHVPAGAVPKDGPSAGVTMTTALASLLSGRPVRADVAMTGEVSLTGRVLPIGGVKQKLLAAHRAGITTVLIPQRNEPDLDDVPAEVLAQLTVHPVSDVREVLPAGTGAGRDGGRHRRVTGHHIVGRACLARPTNAFGGTFAVRVMAGQGQHEGAAGDLETVAQNGFSHDRTVRRSRPASGSRDHAGDHRARRAAGLRQRLGAPPAPAVRDLLTGRGAGGRVAAHQPDPSGHGRDAVGMGEPVAAGRGSGDRGHPVRWPAQSGRQCRAADALRRGEARAVPGYG